MDYKADFLDFLQYHRNLAENTLHSYEFDLREFLQWINQRELRPEDVKLRDIDAFLIWLRKKGNKVQSVNRKAYALKTFYRFLLRNEVVQKNPLDFFEVIKGGKRLPRFLTLEQQEALLKIAKKKDDRATKPLPSWMRERNWLLMLFFIDTGLRVEEVTRVKVEDLDLREGIIRVIGKGDKERIAVISDRLKTAIENYLKKLKNLKLNSGGMKEFPGFAARGINAENIASEIGVSLSVVMCAMRGQSNRAFKKIKSLWNDKVSKSSQPFLFFNRLGKPMISRHLFRLVKDLGRKIGINDLHPHMLRHTFATNLRQKGADLLLMREALGHSSVITTQIYAHLGDQEYRKNMRKFLQ